MIISSQTLAGAGRTIAVVGDADNKEFLASARALIGKDFVDPLEFDDPSDFAALVQGKPIYFRHLGIVLFNDEPAPMPKLVSAKLAPVRKYVPRAVAVPAPPILRTGPVTLPAPSPCVMDTDAATWGLQVTNADRTGYTGNGIRVAVLDSGINLKHPAFAGKRIVCKSFVNAPADQDDGGHGTHCASTLCGNPEEKTGRRYSVAPGVELYIAKIFDAQQSSPEARTLAALNWALENKCQIISLSVGGQVQRDKPYSQIFEAAARAALEGGALLIAGAGNNSSRAAGNLMPVNSPANCPSVMAVGAIDECRKISDGSNPGLNGVGGEVNLVGPGMAILSAGLRRDMNKMDGTSAAVPFVAGIAALWAESDPQLRGQKLWNKLEEMSDQSVGSLADVGRGLVKAPLRSSEEKS
jgi:subtilisin family serine protease